jgi:hypothetical protein
MSVDADLKAQLILEDLVRQLSDAQVDYRYRSGHHEYIINRAGAKHRVAIPERVLLEHPIRELEKAVPRIIRRLLSPDAPQAIEANDPSPWYCRTQI